MEIEPSYQRFLLELYDRIVLKECLGHGDDYWTKCFKAREDDNRWTPIAPHVDCLKMAIDPTTFNPETGKGTICFFTTVSNDPIFWDVTLAYYLIRKPEVYRDPRTLIGMFHQTMIDSNTNPALIRNMGVPVMRWMDEIRNGTITNFQFIEHPLEQIFKLKWIVWVDAKYKETDVGAPDFMEREEVQTDMKQMKTELESRFIEIAKSHNLELVRGEEKEEEKKEKSGKEEALN